VCRGRTGMLVRGTGMMEPFLWLRWRRCIHRVTNKIDGNSMIMMARRPKIASGVSAIEPTLSCEGW
jgi:hypothetical protein